EPRAVLALGLPETKPVFGDKSLQAEVDADLNRPQTMLVDTLTRREFGPANGRRFGPDDHGRQVELNGVALTIAGHFTRGSGLNAGGSVLLCERDFRRSAPHLGSDQVSLGLVRAKPREDVSALAERLQKTLPRDVEVLTRKEVLASEVRHWVWETNYG